MHQTTKNDIIYSWHTHSKADPWENLDGSIRTRTVFEGPDFEHDIDRPVCIKYDYEWLLLTIWIMFLIVFDHVLRPYSICRS